MAERENHGFDGNNLIELTAEIVSAYVGNNPVQGSELPRVIQSVYQSLTGLTTQPEEHEELKPAVSVRKSITDEYLICLEDGKKFKSLKRHLRSKYDMSPEEYREKWKLPADYPMVSPAYARERSRLARNMGLGQVKGK